MSIAARLALVAAALALVALAVVSWPPGASAGGVFTVTKTADTNDGNCKADCSLREAIVAANGSPGADTVDVAAGTYTLSIAGANEDAGATGDLDVTDALTINGADPATTIIDGADIDRVLESTSVALTLSRITVRNGNAGGNNGGGILAGGPLTLNFALVTSNEGDQGAGVVASDLTMNGSSVEGNTGVDQGAGIWTCCSDATFTISSSSVSGNIGGDQGGGIFFCCGDLTLTISDSTVSNNFGDDQGGGIFFCCGDSKGGSPTVITITNSVVDGNESTDQGGGLFYCCGGDATDTITITDSSFSNNTSVDEGGGLFICCEADGGTNVSIKGTTIAGNSSGNDGGDGFGGGIYSDVISLSIVNSTISANTASGSGGGIYNDGTASLTNVTLTDNVIGIIVGGAGNGGGLAGGITSDGDITITNTVVSGNFAPNCLGDGTFTSGGGNVEDTDTCGFGLGNDQPNTDPQIADLADNGGPTLTRALIAGSPAIDAADDAACPGTDQRGVGRPIDGDEDGTAVCDSGAYEFGVAPEPTPTEPGEPGATPTATVAATGLPPTGGGPADGSLPIQFVIAGMAAVAALAGTGALMLRKRA